MAAGIVTRHRRQAELAHPLGIEREADEPAPMLRHEIDMLCRHMLRGHDKVALVLAVFVIDEDKHAPRAGFFEDVFDGGKLAHAA